MDKQFICVLSLVYMIVNESCFFTLTITLTQLFHKTCPDTLHSSSFNKEESPQTTTTEERRPQVGVTPSRFKLIHIGCGKTRKESILALTLQRGLYA